MSTSTLATALKIIERIKGLFYEADDRHDCKERERLGRRLTKAEDAAMVLPALSDADAAAKLGLATNELELSSINNAHFMAAGLRAIAGLIVATDNPRRQFELYWHLGSLRLGAERLPFLGLEIGLLERVLPHVEAAIAWLERPRVEHHPAEGVTIHYVSRGCAIMAPGEPQPELSGLIAA